MSGLTEAQKAFRASGMGGTDTAELVLGSPLKVFSSKVEGHEIDDSLSLLLGRVFEDPIKTVYAHQTKAKVLGSEMARHPRHEIAIGSLDGRAIRDGSERVLECKTANFRQSAYWGDGADEVPERYLIQCQWYMGVTGLAQADLAVLLGGADFRVYTLTADPEMFGQLLELAERFWRDHVIPKRPPEPDGSDTAREWLGRRFTSDGGPILPATPEAETWAKALYSARAAVKSAENLKTEAENHLIAMIGDHAGMSGDGWRVSYKFAKGRAVTDWEAVCVAANVPPQTVEAFTTRTPHRTFRPTFQKGNSND